jgi:proline dehydrogenase
LAKGNAALPFCVFKVTGLGAFELLEKVSAGKALKADEQKAYDRVHARIKNLCVAAKEADVRLLIDAEESWIQPAIDAFALEMMQLCNKDRAIIYNTAQLYRTDRLDAMREWLQLGKQKHFHVGVKVVRGAYMEKENRRAASLNQVSPIFPTKEGTDRASDAAVSLMLDHIDHAALCAGTHNELSSKRLAEQMEAKGFKRNDSRIYFAQLLGMSDHISYNLAHFGFNVAKYVPYGPVSEVLPYLSRRAAENTSVQGQSSRELSLLSQETNRRGLVVAPRPG